MDGGKAVITLQEKLVPKTNSIGVEVALEDNFVKEHIEHFVHGSNMFDGM